MALQEIERKGFIGNMKRFGEKVLRLLESRREPQARAAEAIGVDASQFGKWIKGELAPKVPQLLALAKHFHVKMDYLADDSQNVPEPEALGLEERVLLEIASEVGIESLFRPKGSSDWEPEQYESYMMEMNSRMVFRLSNLVQSRLREKEGDVLSASFVAGEKTGKSRPKRKGSA